MINHCTIVYFKSEIVFPVPKIMFCDRVCVSFFFTVNSIPYLLITLNELCGFHDTLHVGFVWNDYSKWIQFHANAMFHDKNKNLSQHSIASLWLILQIFPNSQYRYNDFSTTTTTTKIDPRLIRCAELI